MVKIKQFFGIMFLGLAISLSSLFCVDATAPQSLLEPQFFWMLLKHNGQLNFKPEVYQNFLQLMLAKNLKKQFWQESLEQKAFRHFAQEVSFDRATLTKDLFIKFCQILSSFHPKACQQGDCKTCLSNVEFFWQHKLAIKNLLYATFFKHRRMLKAKHRWIIATVMTVLWLPCTIAALLGLVVWQCPGRFSLPEAWCGGNKPEPCGVAVDLQKARHQVSDLTARLSVETGRNLNFGQKIFALQGELDGIQQQIGGLMAMLQSGKADMEGIRKEMAVIQERLTMISGLLPQV